MAPLPFLSEVAEEQNREGHTVVPFNFETYALN